MNARALERHAPPEFAMDAATAALTAEEYALCE